MQLIGHLFISELLPIIDVFARAPRTSPITTDTSQLWIRSFTSSHNIHNQNQFPFAPSAWSWRRYRPPPWTWTSLSRGGYSWLEKKIVGGSEKMRHHRIAAIRWRSLAEPRLRLADWRANKLIGTRKVSTWKINRNPESEVAGASCKINLHVRRQESYRITSQYPV